MALFDMKHLFFDYEEALRCPFMNSDVISAERSLSPSAFVVMEKTRAHALPAGEMKAKNCYQHFRLSPPVQARAQGAV